MHFRIKEEGFTLDNILALITMSHGYCPPGIGGFGVGIKKTAGKMITDNETFIIRSFNREIGRVKAVICQNEKEPELKLYCDAYKKINEKLAELNHDGRSEKYPTNDSIILQEPSTHIIAPLDKVTKNEVYEMMGKIQWAEQINIHSGKINYTIEDKYHQKEDGDPDNKLMCKIPLLPTSSDYDIEIMVRVGRYYLPKGHNTSGPRWVLIASGCFEERSKSGEPQLLVLKNRNLVVLNKEEHGIKENLLDWGDNKWNEVELRRAAPGEINHAYGIFRLTDRYDIWDKVKKAWSSYSRVKNKNKNEEQKNNKGKDKYERCGLLAKRGLYFLVGGTAVSPDPLRYRSAKKSRMYDSAARMSAYYKPFVTYENIKSGLDISVIKADPQKVNPCQFARKGTSRNILDYYSEALQSKPHAKIKVGQPRGNYIFREAMEKYNKYDDKGNLRVQVSDEKSGVEVISPSIESAIKNMKLTQSTRDLQVDPPPTKTASVGNIGNSENVVIPPTISNEGFQVGMEGNGKNFPSDSDSQTTDESIEEDTETTKQAMKAEINKYIEKNPKQRATYLVQGWIYLYTLHDSLDWKGANGENIYGYGYTNDTDVERYFRKRYSGHHPTKKVKPIIWWNIPHKAHDKETEITASFKKAGIHHKAVGTSTSEFVCAEESLILKIMREHMSEKCEEHIPSTLQEKNSSYLVVE